MGTSAETRAAQLAELLKPVSQRDQWYDARCPAHDDQRPSFSFADGPDGLILLCRAGCKPAAIIAALRRQYPSATFKLAKRQRGAGKQIVTTYPYRDEQGHLLYEVVRYEPKAFRIRRPDGKGGYVWNMEGVRRVLYRLPDLKDRDVWVVEGEKDADRLQSLYLATTTNPGGAGKWRDEYVQQLIAQGVKSILIIPDRDDAGERHARDIARSCLGAGLKVLIIRPPDLPEKGDISDWLDQGHGREDLFSLVERAEDVTAATLAEETVMGEEQVNTTSGNAWADRLVALAEATGIRLFHAEFDEAFASFPVGTHTEVWPVNGPVVRKWLGGLYWTQFRKAAQPDVLNAAIQTLESKAAFEGGHAAVHLRTAWHEGDLYYDLGDPEWRVVKVTATGWEVLNSSPIYFRRFAGMTAQASPQSGGDIHELWGLLNIPDPCDRRLLVAWLVIALIPNIPRPLLVLHGDQGAGKTTTARFLGALVDPSDAPLVRARDDADLVQALSHRYAAVFDNVSSISDKLSDLLSRAVTGETFSKRRLYSNDEDVFYKFRRALIVTGINLVVTKADLLDRSLIIGTARLLDEQRLEEPVLAERFTAAQPKLFGAILDLLVKAITAYPAITLRLPRMADFGRWAAAVAVGQGRKAISFEHDFQQNTARQNLQAVTESVAATLFLTFMEGKTTWTGTIGELLKYCETLAESGGISKRELPGSPQALGRKLHELAPNLAGLGYDLSFGRSHHPRTITVTRRKAR
jgi:hypothetical protein